MQKTNENEYDDEKTLEEAFGIVEDFAVRIAEDAKRRFEEGKEIEEKWLEVALEELENWAGTVYMSPLYYYLEQELYVPEFEERFIETFNEELGDFKFSDESALAIQQFIHNFSFSEA